MHYSSVFESGRLKVCLVGELDQHEARKTMEDLEDMLESYLPRDLVLDLSGLSFMDSSGIALLIRLGRRVKEMGGRLWIENPGNQARRVIDAAGIDRLIPVASNRI
jgi:stage II sporulation protein AA (anti-sigma F factor antagonist)